MADLVLTPELLMQQSAEMISLQGEYETLFKNVNTSLSGINESWSENLAKNFSGKIQMAQGSFASVTNMFANGGNAASSVARTFENGVVASPQTISSMLENAVGASGGALAGSVGSVIDEKKNSSERNLTSAQKADEIRKHYHNEAEKYRKKATEALKKGDFKTALKYNKKAIAASGEAMKAYSLGILATPGSMLGWDKQENYDAFEKAMENTPIIKDGFGMGKGLGQMAQGEIYEGIDTFGKSLPKVYGVDYGDMYEIGDGMGKMQLGDIYGGADQILDHMPVVKHLYGVAKGGHDIINGNYERGLDKVFSSVPAVKDGYGVLKSGYYWTSYLDKLAN